MNTMHRFALDLPLPVGFPVPAAKDRAPPSCSADASSAQAGGSRRLMMWLSSCHAIAIGSSACECNEASSEQCQVTTMVQVRVGEESDNNVCLAKVSGGARCGERALRVVT